MNFKLTGLRHWMPLFSTIVFTVVYSSITRHFYGQTFSTGGVSVDLVAELLLGYWLYWVIGPLWVFLVLQALVMGVLYIGNAVKLSLLSAPIVPSDINTLSVLFDVLSGWRFYLAIAPLLAMAVLLIFGLRRDRYLLPALVVGIAPLWFLLALAPAAVSNRLDGAFGYRPFAQVTNYNARGPVVYFINEYARERVLRSQRPTQQQVAAALHEQSVSGPLAPVQIAHPRNIYIFLMEAFWDPALLHSVHFSRDPLSADFRALWAQTGDSWVQVPVFGGGTANSEFEVLCGAPIPGEQILFVTDVSHQMPCLPMVLAKSGYRTIAVAPDSYGTWNRNNVYQYVGFGRFYAKESFFLDDLNGEFLSDKSLFEQMGNRVVQDGGGKPHLIYTVTTSGHYPFQMNTTRRPVVVHTDASNPLVTHYANAVFYDSQDLANYIAQIRTTDPDAIIVAFGDHLPALGNRNRDYSDSGLFARDDHPAPEMMRTRQSTPLIVIDGRHGPLKIGRMSLFEIPRLLLKLLDAQGATPLDAFAPPKSMHPRLTTEGPFLVTDDTGGAQICGEDPPVAGCEKADSWYHAVNTLRIDMVSGNDYLAQILYGDQSRLGIPETGLSYHAPMDVHPCNIKITAWGPKQSFAGRPFNSQRKNASSSFWIQFTGDAGRIEAWLGSSRLDVRNNGQLISASLPGQGYLYWPGERALTLKCNGDDTPVLVGEFDVRL
ncbi:MAG TPA: LTA synthase family protein [Gammaproteobacteria bacterium]